MTLQQVIISTVNQLGIYFVALISGLSVLVFIFGVVKYISKGDSEEGRKNGKTFMLSGIIGLFVMFGVWGLVAILANTFDVPTVVPQFDSNSSIGSSLPGSGSGGSNGSTGSGVYTPEQQNAFDNAQNVNRNAPTGPISNLLQNINGFFYDGDPGTDDGTPVGPQFNDGSAGLELDPLIPETTYY